MKLAMRSMLAALLLGAAAAAAENAARPQPEPVATQSAALMAYAIGPEDLIEVFVWKEPELSTTVTVRPDGRISLPLAGELEAAGRTPQQLRQDIGQRLKQYVDQPVVTVIVKAVNSSQISVLGEVRKPGRYRIAQRSTVLDAIALGGGFTDFSDGKDVLVLRTTPEGVRRIHVNVRQLLRDGGKPVVLEAGDTVYVE